MRKFASLAVLGLWLLGNTLAVQAQSTPAPALVGAAADARRAAVAQENGQAMSLISVGKDYQAPRRLMPQSNTGPQISASTPRANGYRAYAPSCVSYPLPDQFSGPLYPPSAAFRVRLAAIQTGTTGYVTEDVNVRVWRVPCSSSGQFFDAVTLLAIDRDPANEGNSNRYPLFPGIRVTQGNNSLKFVRIADEPNTVLSHTNVDEALVVSGTYVLENFPSNAATTAFFDFNNAFVLTFFNFFNNDNGQPLSVGAYNPTTSTYPTAFANQPITGYLTGNWYDTAHSGEGMLIQVFNIPNDSANLLFTFAWFTYDSQGLPFWLFGSKVFPAESRGPLVVPTVYGTNGGFAGNFGAQSTFNTWGTVTFEFPRCYEMKFSYNGSASAAGGPSGTGTRTNWRREVDTNGVTCE